MKTTVAVYDSHEKAIQALRMLEQEGIPLKNVSLVGKAEIVDDQVKIKHHDSIVAAPLEIGVVVGAVTGLLTGVGLFAIPGLGLLYGAGAAVGAIAGLDLGLITGGFLSVMASLGIRDKEAVEYHEHVKEGKFLLIVNGTPEEIGNATEILDQHKKELLDHIET